MHNMVYLIGRLSNDIKENDNKIVLATTRAFKNEEGVYETDFIPVMIYGMIQEKTIEYLKKGDLVGIKGRLQQQNNELVVIADKISFLSTNKEED